MKNKSVIDQGVTYYNVLQENQEAFILLYQKMRGKLFDITDIKWDETRVIFIAPSFTQYQRRASGYAGLPIELYEIGKYDTGILTLNRVETKPTTTTAPRKASTRPRIISQEYTEEGYLDGRYDSINPTPATVALYYTLRTMLLETFPKLEVKQRKHYVGFYSKDDGSSVCTVEVQKHKMIVTYSTTNPNLLDKSDFVHDFTNKGHWGIGNYRSEIRTEDDVVKALSFVQKVYSSK